MKHLITLFFVLYLLSSLTILITPSIDAFIYVVRIILPIIIVLISIKKYNSSLNKSVIQRAYLLILALIPTIISGTFSIFIENILLILLSASLFHFKDSSILKRAFINTGLIYLFITILLFLLVISGIIHTEIEYFKGMSFYKFGFKNSNNIGYFTVIASLILWYYNKLKLSVFGFGFSIITFFYTNNLTALIFSILMLLYYLINKRKILIKWTDKVFLFLLILFGYAVTFSAVLILEKTINIAGVEYNLDKILSLRLTILSSYIKEYEISNLLLGGITTKIDSYYFNSIANQGLIFTVLLTGFYFKQSKHNTLILILFTLIYGFTENSFVLSSPVTVLLLINILSSRKESNSL